MRYAKILDFARKAAERRRQAEEAKRRAEAQAAQVAMQAQQQQARMPAPHEELSTSLIRIHHMQPSGRPSRSIMSLLEFELPDPEVGRMCAAS
jgi:hypothetical protein